MLIRHWLKIDGGQISFVEEKVYTCDVCANEPEEGEELVRTSDYEGGDKMNVVCTACAEEGH
tara:strand:- start:641 stop:826 length:186 start_codon:yes stop_codon:yes gene_type:complete